MPARSAASSDRITPGLSERLSQERLTAVSPAADRELVFTRSFDAPRNLVFEMWTHPDHLARWWGPDGFTLTTIDMDVRAGGTWRFIMHGPDGTDYRNRVVYEEVSPPERLVYRHVPEKDTEPIDFQVTATFVARGPRTDLTMRMIFPTAAALQHVVKTYGADQGATQTLGRLEAHVKTTMAARAARGGQA
jgi:uncharacterized protein YndB with AHSA1/START domain